MKKLSKNNIITIALIIAIYAIVFVLEKVIDSNSMLFIVLKKGAIYALVAVSMNLLNGFTGLFSLGQAGFMLIGAYAYAIFTIPVEYRDAVYQYFDGGIVQFSIPVIPALILAGLAAALFAFLIGLPVLRLKSDYLAIATLGFAEIIRAFFQWDTLGPVTNGSNLLRKFPTFDSTLFPFTVAGICILLIVLLIRGCTGAVKDAFDPNLGVYNATTAEMYGIEMDVTDVWEGGVSIELKAKDKCVFNIDGDKYNIKWTLDGTDINVKGKGLNCDGTLNQGTLVLEDVLGMGVNLTFQKEGGFSDNMLDGDGMTSSDGEIGEDGYTAAQRKWNGAWYGSFQVVEQKNFDYLSDGAVYDALMVIDLGTDNKGTFDLYVFNDYDAPAAAGECEATETSLTATSVEMLGQDLDSVYNWMLLPRQDYTDQYCMGDTFEQDEYYMEFMVFIKPWGASWDKEIADGYNLLPPAMDNYNDLIAEGEMPPVGEAPIGYLGAEAQGATAEAPVENTTETPAQSAAPAEGFDSGTITETVSDYSKDASIDVSVTLPESGWKLSHELTTMYLYNVDDPEHLFSGDPRIQFDIYTSSDKLNYYEKDYENLKDEGTRTIGGVELKARSYKNVGMQWTEYYGEVPGGGWLSIKISKVDIGAGSEGDAVLNSISFK